MAQGLRDRLIGAWKLVSYQETPVDGSPPFEPLGHQPHGIIMYTSDGYMSAQLSMAERPTFVSGDWFGGSTEDYADKVLAVNLTGTFHVTRLAIPHLKNSDGGVAVFISSLGGRFGYPDRSPYATTKRGVIALPETLAIELGAVAGQCIQRVLQGRADDSGRSLDDVATEALSVQSLKRFVEPDSIAALCVFRASDAAKSISGQAFRSTATPRPRNRAPRRRNSRSMRLPGSHGRRVPARSAVSHAQVAQFPHRGRCVSACAAVRKQQE